MTFDIHQLDALQNDYDALIERLYVYIDELIEAFAQSEEAAEVRSAYPSLTQGLGGWVQPLVEMGYNYEAVLLPQMTVQHVERLVTELFPRKIMLMSPDDAADGIPELIAFWQFLQRVYQLPQAKKIIKSLQKIQPKFPAMMNDRGSFGIAKAFFSSGQELGFDMMTQDGLQQFQTVYNQSLQAAPKSPQGFGELLATAQIDSTTSHATSSKSKSAKSKSSKSKPAKGFAKSPKVEPQASTIDEPIVEIVKVSSQEQPKIGTVIDVEVLPQEPEAEDFFKTMPREMMQTHIDSLPALTETQIELLQQQQISAITPGSIITDFQRFLDFIAKTDVTVGPTNHLISSIAALEEINQFLTKPMQIALKRPQQKSYSVIHGLYLLLRCMGLGQIKTKGKKHLLVLDPAVQQHWSRLNPTEQYFTLLEVWLVRGHEEIVGERGGALNCGIRVTQSWPSFLKKGKKLAKYADQDVFHYYPGFMNLALMQLFGMVEIASVAPESGKGWRFKSVKPLAWGDVIIRLVLQGYWEQGMIWPSESNLMLPFGELQSLFQPYFPEWQQNLPGLAMVVRSGRFTFKVSLGKIWRRFAVSGTSFLDQLSDLILDSVGFDRDHLDMFIYKDQLGRQREVMHPYGDGESSTAEVTVGELPIEVGGTMKYVFDFGDWWEFTVQLEQFEPMDLGEEAYGELLESHGEAPEQYPSWDEDD
jgi:hypothetical protein